MILTWLFAPFTYGFMQRGLIASLIVGIVCSVIGAYVVLRSMAFLGDALAHAILPGVALAYLLGGNLLLGALIAAALVALGINLLSARRHIKEDTAIGILFAASLALGIAIISRIRTYATDLSHILFGNVLGVTQADLLLSGALGLLVLASVVLLYRPFLLISFDPTLATTLGLPTRLLNSLMLVLIALTIVISIQTVGVALVAAMLVTPAATAYLLTNRLPTMMALSAAFGAFASLLGLYFSYYADLPSGAAIVLTATAFFILALFFSPRKGVLTRRWRPPFTP